VRLRIIFFVSILQWRIHQAKRKGYSLCPQHRKITCREQNHIRALLREQNRAMDWEYILSSSAAL